jgi:lactate 2-monooxygenase
MAAEGGQIQTSIYLGGEPEFPISPDEWEARAAETLDAGPFDYIAGGAGSESTMRANRQAFDRYRLRPRMLRGNPERDLSVDVLGTRSVVPFLLAPVGVLSIAHPEGELAVARASAAMGVPLILSSAASHSIEEIAEAMGAAPRWFQLYWVNDREIVASFVRRAEAAG